MTVRLRPRQVLCSKCRGICNENSENVDNSRKRKATEDETSMQQQSKRGLNGVSTRLNKPLSSDSQNNERQKTYLALRLPRPVQEQDDHSSEEDEGSSSKSSENNQPHEVSNCSSEPRTIAGSKSSSSKANKIVDLKKKPSAGSMEDLWDETVFEEANLGELGTNTRTIKISFGREGEGTVLKIPAKIEDLEDPDKDKTTSKAARRALKKAKKEARRKILLGSGGSPCYLGSSSSRYPAGLASPRCTVGAASPRYTLASSTAGYENLVPRRHKHKVNNIYYLNTDIPCFTLLISGSLLL